jgi:hypothetical protein
MCGLGLLVLQDRGSSFCRIEMVLSEHFDKRFASLHFSAMRVTNATTFRASTRSTRHTTIVVLNIFGPSTLQLPFLCEYLCQQCSIPRCDECRRLANNGTECRTCWSRSPHNLAVLKRRTQLLRNCLRKNRLAPGAARDRQLLCQRRRRIPFCLFANRPTESLAVILCARMSPVLECAT